MSYLLSYPVMYKKELNEIINDFVLFKSRMGVDVTMKKVQYIWGKGVVRKIGREIVEKFNRSTKVENSVIGEKKIEVVNEKLKYLLIFNWVRFIGVSGSIAAGFAKEEDDIDLFIVVRDGSAWIYRGILTVRNIFNRFMRTIRDGKKVKDLFCINFIIEERALELDSDMFNFHELMFLYPVYNERYLNYIYSKNAWLVDDFYINRNLVQSREKRLKSVNIFIKGINFCAYIAQILYIYISGHRFEFERLSRNYKKGRIEFFSENFKKKVLKRRSI